MRVTTALLLMEGCNVSAAAGRVGRELQSGVWGCGSIPGISALAAV